MITTSTLIVTMMASPTALQLDHEDNFAPVAPKHHLEEMMLPNPIHPLNVNPKKILGDQFVDDVRVIDRRAQEINSIRF